MAEFDMKSWLDKTVVPLLAINKTLSIYSPFWNGVPPKEVLVILMAGQGDDEFDPAAWPGVLKSLLDEHKFRFDFTREQIAVSHDNGLINLFGGDGAPLFNPDGLASARVFRKEEDGTGLILQVASRFPSTDNLSPGQHASAATKAFYSLFEESPLEVCQTYGALFGQA